jgi:hypothetical protein
LDLRTVRTRQCGVSSGMDCGGSCFREERIMDTNTRTNDPAQNPDPITGAPGSHPAGTGLGAAAGGAVGIGGAVAAGAAMGTVVGPVGTAIGAAIGAVVGGLAGKSVAEGINPTAEHDYWRQHYSKRPYVSQGSGYDEYAPAYQYGWESTGQHTGKRFNEVETDLGRDWDRVKGKSALKWDQAKHAVRDGWDHVTGQDSPR